MKLTEAGPGSQQSQISGRVSFQQLPSCFFIQGSNLHIHVFTNELNIIGVIKTCTDKKKVGLYVIRKSMHQIY